MRRGNLHTHSTWCDGHNTPAEMIAAAERAGLEILGFSSHSDMLKDEAAYRAEIRALASEHVGDIAIRCGIEAELGKPYVRGDYDYVIGSLHFLGSYPDDMFSVDDTPRELSEGISRHFGGSVRAFMGAYFAKIRDTLGLDFEIVGHPDIIRKFNEKHPFFDESADWYRRELADTADAIAASGKIVEVNTGAISRGWFNGAYPSPFFRDLLRDRGVRFVLSADAHSAAGIACAFDRYGEAEDFVDCGTIGRNRV